MLQAGSGPRRGAPSNRRIALMVGETCHIDTVEERCIVAIRSRPAFEVAACNGYFGRVCYHPIFVFTIQSGLGLLPAPIKPPFNLDECCQSAKMG